VGWNPLDPIPALSTWLADTIYETKKNCPRYDVDYQLKADQTLSQGPSGVSGGYEAVNNVLGFLTFGLDPTSVNRAQIGRNQEVEYQATLDLERRTARQDAAEQRKVAKINQEIAKADLAAAKADAQRAEDERQYAYGIYMLETADFRRDYVASILGGSGQRISRRRRAAPAAAFDKQVEATFDG